MKSNISLSQQQYFNVHCSCSRGEGQKASLDWRGTGTQSLGASHAHLGTLNRTQPTAYRTWTGGSAGSHHHDPQRPHSHAVAVQGHTGCNAAIGTRLKLRSLEHERSSRTSAASAHTVRCALRRILGSCGAAHDMHRLGRWMDGRLMAGARGVPSATISMARSSRPAASSLTCDAPMTGRLSAIDRAGLRRVCWAQEQLALTCPSTRCRTLWDSNCAGLLGRLWGGTRSTEGRM